LEGTIGDSFAPPACAANRREDPSSTMAMARAPRLFGVHHLCRRNWALSSRLVISIDAMLPAAKR
jgi:hypothetical protein